mmetsp:Transcript_14046/g.42839  ORF Transcript_14046/g.42839 Transcript_14046/m.42839 type:complete len:84 (-) Transcript_14046:1515-1766(-)
MAEPIGWRTQCVPILSRSTRCQMQLLGACLPQKFITSLGEQWDSEERLPAPPGQRMMPKGMHHGGHEYARSSGNSSPKGLGMP